MTMDRTSRLFLDTSDVENALDRVARSVNRYGTATESVARGALRQLAARMNQLVLDSKAAGDALTRPFKVLTEQGQRAGITQTMLSNSAEGFRRAMVITYGDIARESTIATLKMMGLRVVLNELSKTAPKQLSEVLGQVADKAAIASLKTEEMRKVLKAVDAAAPKEVAAAIRETVDSGKELGLTIEEMAGALEDKGMIAIKPFKELSAAQVRMLSTTERARYELLRFNADLDRMAATGSLSAQSIQAMNVRLGQLRGFGTITTDELERMQLVLQRLQNQFVQTNVKAKQATSSLAGMPIHTAEAARTLTIMSSASQGLMLGLSALSGNVTGAAFSLIFLRFSIIKVTVAVAALTVAIMGALGLVKAFKSLVSTGATAGNALEKTGQQIASFFHNVETAYKITGKAARDAMQFGTDLEQEQKSRVLLERIGKNNDAFMAMIRDTAAATGEELESVTQRFFDLSRAQAGEASGIVQKFIDDYDLAIKSTATGLQLVTALQEKFNGAAALAADTNAGAMKRLSNMWLEFKKLVGTVVNEFLRPFIDLAIAFTKALASGFEQARDVALATGVLGTQIADFRSSIQRLIPVVEQWGRQLGVILFNAIQHLAGTVKTVADNFHNWWTRMKPLRELLRLLVVSIKTVSDKLDNLRDKLEGLGVPAPLALAVVFTLGGIAAGLVFRSVGLLVGYLTNPMTWVGLGRVSVRNFLRLGVRFFSGGLAMDSIRELISRLLARSGPGAAGGPGGWVITLTIVATMLFGEFTFNRLGNLLDWIGEQFGKFSVIGPVLKPIFRVLGWTSHKIADLIGLINDAFDAALSFLWLALKFVVGGVFRPFRNIDDLLGWIKDRIGDQVNVAWIAFRFAFGPLGRLSGTIWDFLRWLGGQILAFVAPTINIPIGFSIPNPLGGIDIPNPGDLLGRMFGGGGDGSMVGPNPQLPPPAPRPPVTMLPSYAGMGGTGALNINISIADSVVTNDAAITELARRVANEIANSLSLSRRLSLHGI